MGFTADDVLAGCAIASVCGGGGVFIGRLTRNSLRRQRTRDEEEEHQRREEQRLRQVLTGRPADDFGPREPGLIEQMHGLTAAVGELASNVGALSERMHKHEEDDAALAAAFWGHTDHPPPEPPLMRRFSG